MFTKKKNNNTLSNEIDNPLEPSILEETQNQHDDFNHYSNVHEDVIYDEEFEFSKNSEEYAQFKNLKSRMLFIYIIMVDLNKQDNIPKVNEQELTNYISKQHTNSFVSLFPINNPQTQKSSLKIEYINLYSLITTDLITKRTSISKRI